MPLLDIRNLTIEIDTPQGRVKAVDRFSLTLNEGEIRGLVGESGSGKSLVAKAIMGMNKDNWRISADRMRINDIDLMSLSSRERRKLIGRDTAMIFQEPRSCLDPSMPVGAQLIEVIPSRVFEGAWWQRFFWRKKHAIALLHRVGIKDHRKVMNAYPHELSEVVCQKVMIAMAIAIKPRLLVADEPISAMESTTQAQLLRLLDRMNQNNNTTILLISNDISTIANLTESITVMYCGQMSKPVAASSCWQPPITPIPTPCSMRSPILVVDCRINRGSRHCRGRFHRCSIYRSGAAWAHVVPMHRNYASRLPRSHVSRTSNIAVTSR